MLKELHDLAGQHEVIAENIQGQLVQEAQKLVTDMKNERRKVSKIMSPHPRGGRYFYFGVDSVGIDFGMTLLMLAWYFLVCTVSYEPVVGFLTSFLWIYN